MIRIHRRQALGGLVALGLGARPANARATFPVRPIRVIAAAAAGGVGEAVMRVLAPALEKKLGDRLLIEAKPGASGYLGSLEVSRATPDGYTLLLAPTSNFVVNQFLMKMAFDPLEAFLPIAKIAEIPIIFCASPALPVRDLGAFVAHARAHRGELNFGTPGNGSINHLLVEKLVQLTGIEMTQVSYRGMPQAALATVAGEIQLFPMGFAVVGGHLREGKLTALAVTASERLPMLPDVPTVAEAGFPELGISNWWALAAPQGTPEPIIRLLEEAVGESLREPAVAERYAALGVQVPTQTSKQFIAGLASEAEQWSQVIRRGNIAFK